MSYKSRQKKRAIRAAQARYRDVIPHRHYRTIVKRDCSCNRCGGVLRIGRECIYRHTPREVLCTLCAERAGISSRPSQAWERWRSRENKRGLRSA